jgi:sterol desaturase/sphingolipid hydroxylase (fatty acid hydroxylase superfamily)
MANQVLKAERAETCRMFESDFLERFSRIHPATPFIAWIPVVLLCLVRAAHGSFDAHAEQAGAIGAPVIAAAFLGGMLAWTVAEYFLHRYVFHWTNDTAWGRRVHFLLHGVHHDYPSDRDRLVMPLLTSIPLAVIFYTLFISLLHHGMGEAAFAGFVVGYLFYDGTHFYVHHFVPTGRWGKFLRRHHMTHHFADHDGGFGVSSPLWDLVLRTMPSKRR